MSIDLIKGQRVDLAKEAPGLKKVLVGLGWDANPSEIGEDFDLDTSVFMLGTNSKLLSEKHFVFYNNLSSPCGSVVHTGDNLTGVGSGDDEVIKTDLSKLEEKIQELVFVVTIHEAEARKQNFGQVSNAFIRLCDELQGQEILKYELDEDYSLETAIEFGRIYKRNNLWKFQASGTGSSKGLKGFLERFV